MDSFEYLIPFNVMSNLVELLFKIEDLNKQLSFPYFLNTKIALFTSPIHVLNSRFSVLVSHSNCRFWSVHIYSFLVSSRVQYCIVSSFAWCFDFIFNFMYCKCLISIFNFLIVWFFPMVYSLWHYFLIWYHSVIYCKN